MFVPNWVDVYGSTYTQAKAANNKFIEIFNGECYHYEMTLTKSGLKAIDQPTEPCDSFTKDPNTSGCIARYIEDQIGCSVKIQGGRSTTETPLCTLSSDLNALKNITTKLKYANAKTIYDLTGCLASCKRNEYAKIVGSFVTDDYCYPGPYPYDLQLDFKITTGSYKEEEQYMIYDFTSFIGDAGGILGLLLGCSVLSLYNELGYLLERVKPNALLK